MEVVFEIIIPFCMSELIDTGIDKGNMSVVWKYGLGVVLQDVNLFTGTVM